MHPRQCAVFGVLVAVLLAAWAYRCLWRGVVAASSVACVEAAAARASPDRPAFVLFHAQWCPNCAEAKRTYRGAARGARAGAFMEVDIDTVPSAVKRYGVQYVPIVLAVTGPEEHQVRRLGQGENGFGEDIAKTLKPLKKT
jgi:thiol-disulfide isomerase/thioredoxin